MITPTIGELRESIDILNVGKPYGVNGAGTVLSTFRSSVRAKIVPLGGELVSDTQARQTYAERYDVWIRHIAGVNAFQQLDWAGTRLAQTAPPETIGRWILFHAEEATSRKS